MDRSSYTERLGLDKHGGRWRVLANPEELGEVELQIEKLRRRYSQPITEATTDRYGRKVLAYPAALDRVGIRAYSLQYILVNSEDDIKLWSLLTKEEDLLKRQFGYLDDIEQH